MTFNTLLLIIYLSSLLINLLTSIIVNFEDLHTLYDFVFPIEDFLSNIFIIYFPISNSFFTLFIMFYGICLLIKKILNIKIK